MNPRCRRGCRECRSNGIIKRRQATRCEGFLWNSSQAFRESARTNEQRGYALILDGLYRTFPTPRPRDTRFTLPSGDIRLSLDAFFMFNRYEQIPFAESARGVTVYSVKERSDPDDFILYCSDGQCTAFFAQQFYSFHPNAPVWFVGVNCSPNHRNAEYVIGRDDARFLIHESFFVDRLLGWTEKTIGIRHSRARAGVFGYSCGGAFAASMGIRHPGIYAAVFAFSQPTKCPSRR